MYTKKERKNKMKSFIKRKNDMFKTVIMSSVKKKKKEE